MEPYRQKWPRLITMQEWRVLTDPDVLALPWIADNGAEICSFALQQIDPLGVTLVLLYDAHGREVVRARDYAAIEATGMKLWPYDMVAQVADALGEEAPVEELDI